MMPLMGSELQLLLEEQEKEVELVVVELLL
jgi:hypothetical protein